MKKILICDDHPAMIEATENILKSLGYETQAMISCEDIVEKVKSIRPDLILMDIRMPGMNGDTATKILKNDPSTRHIPVIIFSADMQFEPKAKAAGADDFVGKPFEISDLHEKIASLVNIESI